jgi:hypothetical protein
VPSGGGVGLQRLSLPVWSSIGRLVPLALLRSQQARLSILSLAR